MKLSNKELALINGGALVAAPTWRLFNIICDFITSFYKKYYRK